MMDRQEIEKFLREAPVGRLGTAHDHQPYVVPLNFVYDGNRIYFHSKKKGMKITHIRENEKVCFEIDEFKGIITADKACATVARTRGLDPIYFQSPLTEFGKNSKVMDYKIPVQNQEDISVKIPIGRLIYELAVQFGEINLKWKGKKIALTCDIEGKTIDNWIYKRLMCSSKDLAKLQESHYGMFDFYYVSCIWQELLHKFMGVDNF